LFCFCTTGAGAGALPGGGRTEIAGSVVRGLCG